MIAIDGAQGEGGGQVLRTALGLSMCTGRSFTITDIRGTRRKPGLLRQHLTAVQAAAEISGAGTAGAALNSQALTFRPGPIRPGKYGFAIGTAGSCTLVFQALLPALLRADGPSEITIEGGTHNPMAPTVDFLTTTFAPLLRAMGVGLEVRLERPGFHPAGGGRVTFRVQPSARLCFPELMTRTGSRLRARVTVADLAEHIGRREAQVLAARLGLAREHIEMESLQGVGPGNVVAVFVDSAELSETFTGFGEKGLKAERVAARVAGQVRTYQRIDAPVGPYLADQLLIPLALAGVGRFLTGKPTLHTRTNIQVIRLFLDTDLRSEQIDEGRWLISA